MYPVQLPEKKDSLLLAFLWPFYYALFCCVAAFILLAWAVRYVRGWYRASSTVEALVDGLPFLLILLTVFLLK